MRTSSLQRFLAGKSSPTVKELFSVLNETGAACLKIVPRNKADEPLGACICCTGKEETAEILQAVEAIEAKWHEED